MLKEFICIYTLISFIVFFPQDVCIPDLIKLLDILGDNGVNSYGT